MTSFGKSSHCLLVSLSYSSMKGEDETSLHLFQGLTENALAKKVETSVREFLISLLNCNK